MSLFPSDGPTPQRPVSKSPAPGIGFDATVGMCDAIFGALTGRDPFPPARPEPEDQKQPDQPAAALRFSQSDVFELVIAGTQIALWALSSDRQDCAVCGSHGADLSHAEGHHPLCAVRRWWHAAENLKVRVEVR